MLQVTYDLNFSLELMTKDIRYAALNATSCGTELRLAEVRQVDSRRSQGVIVR
jgi:3-hydroxyisobutyrate dehydrogenase-like beta-hydroxyacid dehydrogenase